MDRPPVPRDIRIRAVAVAACLATALLLSATSANGKKPPWAGHPHAPHAQRPAGGTAPLAAAPSTQSAPAASPKNASKPGKGNGKGRAVGRQRRLAQAAAPAGAAAAPQSFAPGGAASPPAPQPKVHASKKHHAGSRAKPRATAGPGAARPGSSARAASAAAVAAAAPLTTRPGSSPHKSHHPTQRHHAAGPSAPTMVIRTFDHVVRVVPAALKAAVAVLAFIVLVGVVAYFFLARTTRYLARQRKALLGEIGVLQAALLPDVPDEIGGLRPSVAYRPADGPAAGGDFYDAFPLERGRVGIVIGDISGHGRDALMRTSLLRHTLRAYLDAGLEPRAALQVGGRVLEREADELATVIVATYEPASQMLRYASAGHPPPVFLGPADHVPVTQASSPPIGVGVPTGLRQTTVSVPHGSAICLFTDGLIEARRDGRMIGRLGVARIISELDPEMNAATLLDRVAAEADGVFDDMAACLFRVEGKTDVEAVRIEELELRRDDLGGGVAGGFLAACGVEHNDAARLDPLVRETVDRFGRALVRVTIAAGGASCEVLPANVESLAAATSQRGAVAL